MSLAVADGVDMTIARILACTDVFAVLELQATTCRVDDVKKSYDEVMATLRDRKAIRNPRAVKARAIVDDALARLRDPKLLAREKSLFVSRHALSDHQRQTVDLVLKRTTNLELSVNTYS